jgi:hypothetical protein
MQIDGTISRLSTVSDNVILLHIVNAYTYLKLTFDILFSVFFCFSMQNKHHIFLKK